jgi:hypothetical protein
LRSGFIGEFLTPALAFQLGPQPHHRVVQPRLHRSGGDLQSARYVVHGQIAVEAQSDHDLVVGLEADEGSIEGIARQQLAGSFGRRQAAAFIVLGRQLDDRMAASMAEPVAADVDDDAAEPLLESVAVAERLEPPPGQDRGVVSRVFGLGRVAEDNAGQPIRGVEVAANRENSAAASTRPRSAAMSAATPCPSFSRSSPRGAFISPPLRLTSQQAGTFSELAGQRRGAAPSRAAL